MKSLNKIFCKIFGHDWRYNHPSLPNKCICKRCKQKQMLNLLILRWNNVESFDKETRTDEELIKKWFK